MVLVVVVGAVMGAVVGAVGVDDVVVVGRFNDISV